MPEPEPPSGGPPRKEERISAEEFLNAAQSSDGLSLELLEGLFEKTVGRKPTKEEKQAMIKE